MMGWAITLLLLIASWSANAQFADSTGPELESGDNFRGGGVVGEADDYFISSTGTDPSDCSGGTQAAPWLTLQKANDCVSLEGADIYLKTGSLFTGENLYVTWGTRTGTKPAIVDTYCESDGVAFRWADGAPGCGEAVFTHVHYDNEYGLNESLASGVCPNIPTSFPNSPTPVSTESAFNSAYAAADPGDAVIIANGTYTWGSLVLNRPGVYVLAESYLGVTFFNNGINDSYDGDISIEATDVVVAGFRLDEFYDGGSTVRVGHEADRARVACNHFTGPNYNSGGPYYASEFLFVDHGQGVTSNPGTESPDDVELDNNIFDGENKASMSWGVLVDGNYPRFGAIDLDVPKRTHIHHNVWQDLPTNVQVSGEALTVGTENGTGVNRDETEALIENNYVDNWGGDPELFGMKSAQNIVRNNCIELEPGAGQSGSTQFVSGRGGESFLVYGNWVQGAGVHARTGASLDSQFVFNYINQTSSIYQANIFWYGQTVGGYPPPDDAVFRYNVVSGVNYMLRQVGTEIGEGPLGPPTGMVVSDNDVYSTNWISDYLEEGSGAYSLTFAEWQAAGNTYSNNTINTLANLSGAVACGDPSLFDGPGTSYTPLPSSPSTTPISSPSWWD